MVLYLPSLWVHSAVIQLCSWFVCFASDASVTCWSGVHWAMVFAAVISLACYYPIATFLFPSFQFVDRGLDIKFSPSYLVFLQQAKLLVAGLAAFFPLSTDAGVAMVVSALIFYISAGVTTTTAPCLVGRVNVWRSASLGIAAWAATSTGLRYFLYSWSSSLVFCLIFLGIGWLAITVIAFALHRSLYGMRWACCCGCCCCRRPKEGLGGPTEGWKDDAYSDEDSDVD